MIQDFTAPKPNPVAFTLGLLSILLGLGALLVGWIPFLGLLAIPVAAIGCFLAVLGFIAALFKNLYGIGMPVAGGVICGAAIMVSLTSTGVTTDAIAKGLEEEKQGSERVIWETPRPVETGSPTASADIEPVPESVPSPAAPLDPTNENNESAAKDDSPGPLRFSSFPKTWTSKRGKTTKATLLQVYEIERGVWVALFEKPDGSSFEYKISELSEADIKFIETLRKKK